MDGVEVYVDVLFLINLGMDALCLTLTARLLHRRITLLRLWLAAAAGGLYGVATLFLEVGAPVAWLADIAVCGVMCLIAMGGVRLWATTGVYFLASAVMGGAMTALYSLFNRMGVAEVLPGGGEETSALLIGLLGGLGWLLSLLWGRIFRRSEAERETALELTVCVGNQRVTLRGKIDSGNMLTDPIGGTPVIVARRETLSPLWSEELQEALLQAPLQADRLISLPEASRLRLIPAETATGDGMLVAILPDTVCLRVKQQEHRVRALIAPVVMNGEVAEAMVPPSLLL